MLSGKEAYTEEQAKKRKYRSCRERVSHVLPDSRNSVTPLLQKFKRRTSVVRKNEMDKYWKHLSLLYMTEESDDSENPNGIVDNGGPRVRKILSSCTCMHTIVCW